MEKKYYVDLEKSEKTELDKKIDLVYGHKDLTIYDHIERTHRKYMGVVCSENIAIITDEIPPQTYKVGMFEIEIVNYLPILIEKEFTDGKTGKT